MEHAETEREVEGWIRRDNTREESPLVPAGDADPRKPDGAQRIGTELESQQPTRAPETRSRRDKDGDGDDERERHHASSADDAAMLHHDGHLPQPVLVVLPANCAKRPSRGVEDTDRGIHHDSPPGPPKPEVELVVLISHEGLVEESGELECPSPEGAVWNCVDLDTASRRSISGPVNSSERTIHRDPDSPLHRRSPSGHEETSDVVSIRLFGCENTAAEVVRGVARVTIEAHDQFPRHLPKACVEPGGNQSCGILDHRHIDAVAPGGLQEEPCGAVRGGAVGDQNLDVPFEVLVSDVGDEPLDVLGLVSHRHDDGDAPHRIHSFLAYATGAHRPTVARAATLNRLPRSPLPGFSAAVARIRAPRHPRISQTGSRRPWHSREPVRTRHETNRRTPDLTPGQPERGYGWLAAVIPAEARRFRISDPKLAALLNDVGAELIDVRPDVEIAPARQLRGDAAVSIAVLGRPARGGRSFAMRAVWRLAMSARARVEARRARRTVARLGFGTVEVLGWDHQRTLRHPSAKSGSRRLPVAEYFPRRALVIGRRSMKLPTLLDAVLAEAGAAVGRSLRARSTMIRSGLLVVDTGGGILRVAVGPGSWQIEKQREALAALEIAGSPPIVAERIPWEISSGRCGLADWSLERTLSGKQPRRPVTGPLLADCLDFLVALHRTGRSPRRDGLLLGQAELIAEAWPREQSRIRALAERLETVLADVPRGFAHGDFFHGNLLAEEERLVGVADWDAAGPGRLPLLDLLHLRLTSARELGDIDWGPEFARKLLPEIRAGGDSAVHAYCSRIGLDPQPGLLEALASAYWLDYVSYRLGTHPHQLSEPRWAERTIGFVVQSLEPTSRA